MDSNSVRPAQLSQNSRPYRIGLISSPSLPHRRHMISQRLYFEKYYGKLGALWVKALNRLQDSWPGKWADRPAHRIEHLGAFDQPVELRLPGPGRYLLELAVTPTFLLACGIIAEGDRWCCPRDSWDWFFQGRYFMRALDRDSLAVCGAWSFDKSTPGRLQPLGEHEIHPLEVSSEGTL